MQKLNSKFKTDLTQRTYSLSLAVINLMNNLPQKRAVWVIADQLLRSSTSIGANIVEARASSSRLEFKKFYEISLKSANETKYWFNLLKDAKFVSEKDVQSLIQETDEISRMLGSSVMKLKNIKF
jgi:four helix bundle protein